VEKLRLQNGARFDEAAKTAFDEGRVGLATKVEPTEPKLMSAPGLRTSSWKTSTIALGHGAGRSCTRQGN
jgi:hypothetical protein